MSRAAGAAALACLVVLLWAAPARSHARFAEATNFDSRVTGAPAIPGVTWELFDGGELIRVTNTGPHELVIRGYEGEPYLRVGPSGVFQNLSSPAAYLNRERLGDVAVPPRADPAAPPAWARIADGPSHAWHDHRTHWKAPGLPTAARESPAASHLVERWEVPVSHAGAELVVAGELWWIPPPSPVPWLVLSLLILVPTLVALRRTGGRAVVRAAAATVAAVAVANLAYVPDEILARPAEPVDIGFGIFHTLLFVGAGIGGAWWAWRARWGRRLALGIAAGAVLFHQGLLHLPVLGASQLPTIWSQGFVRLLVAASLTQAMAVAVALAATRPGPPARDHRIDRPEEEGTRMKVRNLATAVILVLTMAACGNGNGNGGETSVSISMIDIDFEPDRVEVPAGEVITVSLTNDGATEHDFHLDDGTDSGILQPGESATLDIGPFEASTVAWCNVPGHREAGMEVEIAVG